MGLCLSCPPAWTLAQGRLLRNTGSNDRSLGAYEPGLGQQGHASSAGMSPSTAAFCYATSGSPLNRARLMAHAPLIVSIY